MSTTEWLKPGLIGAVLGGAIVAVGGFSWAGWTTESRAQKMAQSMAGESVIAALVPVCVERSASDPGRVLKLATVRQASGTGRRDAVLAAGWATIPDDVAASRKLADACVTALDLPAA